MRSGRRPELLLAALWIALAGVAARGQAPEPAAGRFDPWAAVQEHEPGLRFFPWGSGDMPYADPAGLEAHLVPESDVDTELVYPCGAWGDPPSGWYSYWLEGGWRMSPHAGRLSTGGGSMTAGASLVDAGRVALAPREVEAASPNLVLVLLQAETPREGKSIWWEIVRRKPVAQVGPGLLMPEGRVIGALWDRKKRRYVALSRPFAVRGGRTVEATLRRPAGRADLMVRLDRPRDASPKTAADLGAVLAVQQGGGERPPDVVVESAERVYAFWYGLPPGAAELRAEALGTFLVPRQFDLAAGRIEYLAADLAPGPALTVEVDLPAALRDAHLAVSVRRAPGGEAVAKKPIGQRQTFEGLPPARLEVELSTRLGTLTREVDLRSGQDGYLLLKPELVTLAGTVYRGDRAHPAKLTFTTVAHATVEAETDEEGAYEAVLLEPARSVSIELAGVEQEPYFDVLWQAVEASQTLDFHLPDATFAVDVLDAHSRKGIANAAVRIRNVYQPEEPAGAAAGERAPGGPSARPARPPAKERVVVQQTRTNEEGVARLPPLRRGSLEIEVSAEGYLAMRQPVEAQVIDGTTTDQVFEVLLEPLGPTIELRLRLPGGAPASGAEVSLVDSLATGRSLFAGRANGEGVAALPREVTGLVLVKHEAAAFLVREWQPGEGEGELAWDLPAAAERALTIQVQDAAGQALPGAELALWVAGRRLAGSALGWLTDSHPLADVGGSWTAAHLPRGPLSVLAWGRGSRSAAVAGSLDAQATAVPFPWPDPVEVRALE